MLDANDKREIEKMVLIQTGKIYGKRVGDTPNDSLQLVPKKYVNLNGLIAQRPSSSVASIGQYFYATDTNQPMWYSGTNWRNGSGSVVAQG